MENETDPDRDRPQAETPDLRPSERFIVRAPTTGEERVFTDPREAGAAFFSADPADRPSVIHAGDKGVRHMAGTELHGQHEDREPRYFKSLPSSHAPDAAFRAGFLEAMETSVTERLGKVDWEADATSRFDARLKDDLEAFARREPEKAAALWNEHTGETPPGPELRAAVQVMEVAAERDSREFHAASDAGPKVIAMGDWVTTDQNVELRPVAVSTERGIHTGYEASVRGGDGAITFSERTFPNSREALRHSWDFYEGAEEGVTRAVVAAAELAREPDEPVRSGAPGLVVETHVPDARDAIGTGTFTDGEGSGGFLPENVLAVTSRGRDGERELIAQLPDQTPLSAAVAAHLAENPAVIAHAQRQRERAAFIDNPGQAISDWLERSEKVIHTIPRERQQELRSEVYGIAAEAAKAFGIDREREQIEAPPRSTLYSTTISATAMLVGAERVDLDSGAGEVLKAGIQAAALEAGIDGAKVERRLETGAANAHQEETWVKSDIAEVADRHRLDLGDEKARGRAAELVDRFYEKAAELVHAARTAEVMRDRDHLVETLGTMANVHANQGAVAFRNEDQARDFAEEMKARYGASVLKDMAEGRTEALAKDIPDPSARQAMAEAVVAAAKEHPAIGLSAQEIEGADRRLSTTDAERDRAREQAQERSRDREF